MPENSLTQDFVEWVSDQLHDHKDEIEAELRQMPQKKTLAVTIKLKLKKIVNVAVPSYSFSVPRAAVKSETTPDKQLGLPGV